MVAGAEALYLGQCDGDEMACDPSAVASMPADIPVDNLADMAQWCAPCRRQQMGRRESWL